jgi:4-hydroxythreonine-4-phosphate dehydrogenase
MLIGITMGDSSGVGPEILLKAYREGRIPCPAIVYGDLAILQYCNELLGYAVPLRKAKGAADAREGFLNVHDFGILQREDLAAGKMSKKSAAAAREYVIAAARAALNGEIAALVTLPMNKAATQLSDAKFCGHTELIAELCGVKDFTMMLASDELFVTHVSTHVPLARAIEEVRRERILKVIDLTHEALKHFIDKPRIAAAGLNPHAGENGAFGREEIEEIEPAVDLARSKGIDITGPVPPDTVFYLAVRKKRFDAVICMYHDQGHIPLKLLDFEGGVNITLGLPIIRTSVDHGTAFDIAYQGTASIRSFANAVKFAVRMTESR